jgi:D-alanine-D-alanine ligase
LGETSILRAAARVAGLDTLAATFERILASACVRYGISPKPVPRTKKRTVRVGLTYNEKRIKPGQGGENDVEAEFDSPTTIDAIVKAIASHGHEVVKLEATPELASTLGSDDVDVVFNVAEGMRGRNRESQVPALLELLDIPYTGSDPATLALALDKGLAKRVVGQAGFATPRWAVLATGKEKLPKDLRFPVVVKPIAEGSSKGVLGKSVAYAEEEARDHARAIVERYGQPALVEEFLPGREFTVAILGHPKPRVLAPMEIVFRPDLKDPIYTFDHKLDANDEVRYEAPAKLDPKLLREIERLALGAFTTLGCRDVARIDLRLDASGHPSFIECNPLPGLTPGWSDICLIATAVGLSYEALIGEILAPALRRSRKRASTHASTHASTQTERLPAD